MVTTQRNATADGTPLRILVTDEIISRFEPELTSDGRDGHTWTFAAGKPEAEILAALAETDVVVCSGMSTAMARAGAGVRLVHVTGAGCDGIPFGSLAPGVAVANTFHHGRSIAEHVLMCVLMLSRRVQSADRELRSGLWRTVRTDPGLEFGSTLEGRTLGLIGLGEIGLQTARLVSAMGMRVRAVRRNPAAAVPEGISLDQVGGIDELPLLLAASDVVVVTAPLSEETRGLVGAEAFKAMKPTAILVN
ncbi:MAG TPA: NAD(P)-dependent oxidoreductase, partial [Streptomyces sp.]|nr:NAD(P)-dependent oxidoreductase [Streptomyces sp.]